MEKLKTHYLYIQVKEKIIGLIKNNLEDSEYKLPPECVLAKKLHVSRVTVRKAMKELLDEGIIERKTSKGTRVIKQPIIQNNKLIKEHNNLTIGVILPSISSEYTQSIFSCINEYCHNIDNFNITLCLEISFNDIKKEANAINKFIKHGVDGFIIYPTDNQKRNPAVAKIRELNIPIVLIDRTIPDIDISCVISNNRFAFEQAVDYLYKKGYSKILFYSGTPFKVSATDNRLDGFKQGLLNHNIYPSKDNIIISQKLNRDATQLKIKQAYIESQKEIEQIIESGKISAIICACTTSSILLLRVVEMLKHVKPKILSNIFILYCDLDSTQRENHFPSPTCLIQDYEKIGQTAIKALINQIYSGNKTPKKYVIPFNIIRGQTKKKI